MTHSLLTEYLIGQSDLGVDEVILPYPRISTRPFTQSAGVASASLAENSQSVEGSGISASIFVQLAKSLDANLIKKNKAENFDPFPLTKKSEILPVPSFSNLEEYWKYLESAGREFFEASAQSKLLKGTGQIGSQIGLINFQPIENSEATAAHYLEPSYALLEKMMKAIHLDLSVLYKTSLCKFYPNPRVPTRREMNRIFPLLTQEIKLAQLTTVLLLGENCAQSILKTGKGMDELRQIPHRENDIEFIVTYHPDDLLKQEVLKRKAWDDLKWLQKRMLEAKADR